MLRLDAAAGNRADLQQLVRQTAHGNDVVARSAFRALGARRVAGKNTALVSENFARRAGARQAARLQGRALAEDGRAEWRGKPVESRRDAHLGTAASDLLRRALLPRASKLGDAAKIQGDGFSNRRVHGRFRVVERREKTLRTRPALHPRAGMLQRLDDDEPDLRAGVLALGAECRTAVARAARHGARAGLGQSHRESFKT